MSVVDFPHKKPSLSQTAQKAADRAFRRTYLGQVHSAFKMLGFAAERLEHLTNGGIFESAAEWDSHAEAIAVAHRDDLIALRNRLTLLIDTRVRAGSNLTSLRNSR